MGVLNEKRCKTFACQQNLESHINKKYKCNLTITSSCEWCDKSFANKYARVRHENSMCPIRRKQVADESGAEKIRLFELKLKELETMVKDNVNPITSQSINTPLNSHNGNIKCNNNGNHITTTNITINLVMKT
jgi:hypothetical protein